MSVRHRELLKNIRTFPSLVKYLRDELDWPIQTYDFEELTFDYTAEELGIDSKNAAKIQEIKRLRPLSANQPWGIFFVKFEPKKLPVVALRRILSRVVVKKRASANNAERAAWDAEDLLFISNYGEGEERKISLAHFTQDRTKNALPTLKILGWDNLDTALHLDHVAEELQEKLAWPEDENDIEGWRKAWRSAFTLRHREVITTSKVLAIKLAELARDIHARIKIVLTIETEDGPVRKLMKAFQEALIDDLDEDGFADMYAQTITYGLLSARITSPEGGSANDFAERMLVTNPFLKELMETFLFMGGRKKKAGNDTGIDFDEIGTNEVVELLDDANMEAVVRDFGDRNPQEDPVIHFYELFLKEYDAKKRMLRGVFYTPRPVVSYIVRSVDEILRTKFELEDGLADITTWGEMAKRHEDLEIPGHVKPWEPFVKILDPATGTGTFLVEVIDIIYKTMMEKWRKQEHSGKMMDDLWNEYVLTHLLPRVYGYEILMAPYAIAHMKIGLKLFETGYNFGSDERARIYLTNALEPKQDFSDRLDFAIPALAHEAEAVNAVKQQQCFTVVIGNPPYANFGQMNKRPFIRSLLEDYKRGLDEKKLNIDDDFIKFIRFAQWQVERAGFGILGFITNHTYLDGITHRQMRKYLSETFDQCSILDLHGSTKRDELPPDGESNENVFDITVGVAIGLFERGIKVSKPSIQYAELWGERKKKYLFLSNNNFTTIVATPVESIEPYFFFVPKNLEREDEYCVGSKLSEMFCICKNGIQTDRDDLFIDIDKDVLSRRIRLLFSGDYDEEFKARYRVYASSSFDIEARLRKTQFDSKNLRKCLYRPFDFRWLYYDPELTSRPAFEVMQHLSGNNRAILCSRQQGALGFRHVFCTDNLTERCAVSLNSRECAYVFPLFLKTTESGEKGLLMTELEHRSNLAQKTMEFWANKLGLAQSGVESNIFDYVYGLLHSPMYRARYAELLKIDFPRMLLPSSVMLFHELAKKGGELVALHLMESLKLDEHITSLVGSCEFRVEKVSYSDTTVWLDKAMTCGFQSVPDEVWNFRIGSYQVCEKWLKDRQAKGGKNPCPGRVMTDEDIVHYQKIVVALNETIRIMSEIDEVIDKHGGWPDAFK